MQTMMIIALLARTHDFISPEPDERNFFTMSAMARHGRWKTRHSKTESYTRKGEKRLVQHGDSLIGNGLTEKSDSRDVNCLSCIVAWVSTDSTSSM